MLGRVLILLLIGMRQWRVLVIALLLLLVLGILRLSVLEVLRLLVPGQLVLGIVQL